MTLNPFRGQAETLQPVVADLAVVRTVIGFAPAPPALLATGAPPDLVEPWAVPSDGAPLAPAVPSHLAPVPLPGEIFDADELLG